MIQRRKPLKRKTPLFRGSTIRKMSPKRRIESRLYYVKRLDFLEAHPFCQVWLDDHGMSQTEAEHFSGCSLGDPAGGACLGKSPTTIPRSTDIHHKAGRSGENYLDETTWMAVSRQNHDKIHKHPKWARERGYLT